MRFPTIVYSVGDSHSTYVRAVKRVEHGLLDGLVLDDEQELELEDGGVAEVHGVKQLCPSSPSPSPTLPLDQ